MDETNTTNEINELETILALKKELDLFKQQISREINDINTRLANDLNLLNAKIYRLDQIQLSILVDLQLLKEAMPQLTSQSSYCLQELNNLKETK